MSPRPDDRHHGHEVVARASRRAIEGYAASIGHAPAWWVWGLWGGLPMPSLAGTFELARLEEIVCALDAHQGELDRNDYRKLLRGRAEAISVLGG